jgi:AcrR family transcriptional regulator
MARSFRINASIVSRPSARIVYVRVMSNVTEQRVLRRAQTHASTRTGILDAARRVAARGGPRELSLRSVAAEAGFAPAALYGYFASKDELLLALAADELAMLSRAMREAAVRGPGPNRLSAAAAIAMEKAHDMESLATASGSKSANSGSSEAQRLFNGRLIAALKTLSDAAGNPAETREAQCDAVLLGAAVAGLALLARSGRLKALGFTPDEIVQRLDRRFSAHS